jgi:hypothetical protein
MTAWASLYGFEVDSEPPLARLNATAGTQGALRIEAAAEPPDVPHDPISTLVDERGRDPRGLVRRAVNRWAGMMKGPGGSGKG